MIYFGCKMNFSASIKINLPDTIVFTNKRPIRWFYSDKNGKIKKKKI